MNTSYEDWMNSSNTAVVEYRKWMNLPDSPIPTETVYRMPEPDSSAVAKWKTATTRYTVPMVPQEMPVGAVPFYDRTETQKAAPKPAAPKSQQSFAQRMAEARRKAKAAKEAAAAQDEDEDDD